MTPEDRLRDAMQAYTDQVEPDPAAFARLRARLAPGARRSPRLRLAFAGLAGAVVVAAGVVAAVTLTDRDDPGVSSGPAGPGEEQEQPQPSTSPTTATDRGPTTTTRMPAGLPEVFVGVRDHGTELFVADSLTGRVLRVLVDLGPYREPDGDDPIGSSYIDGLSVTPDGRDVYYSVGPEPASGVIYRISIEGGEPEQVLYGYSPVLSPDGKKLAYTGADDTGIVVRELASGTDHAWKASSPDGLLVSRVTAWSADGRWLAFEPHGKESSVATLLLDTSAPGDLSERSQSLSRDSSYDADTGEEALSLMSAGFRAVDGLVGVIEVCCPGPEGIGMSSDGGDSFAVIDPAGGLVKGRIDLPFKAVQAVYDRSGKHQLFVTADGRVHRRSSGPEFTPLGGSDVSLVAW